MKKTVKKVLVGIEIAIVSIPILLITLFIVIETIGYIANHAATDKQTKELTAYIEESIEDANIIDIYSFTGNTSGTGDLVECELKVTFNSDMSEDDVDRIFEVQDFSVS